VRSPRSESNCNQPSRAALGRTITGLDLSRCAMRRDRPCTTPGRLAVRVWFAFCLSNLPRKSSWEDHGKPPKNILGQATKRPALLPPYTTGSVRIRSNLDIKLGRVIGGWQWRAADRSCASRCGHSSRRASGLGVAFVGALCWRIDSQGIDPRSLNWKISSPGKARDRSPRPRCPCTTLGSVSSAYRYPRHLRAA
jgi:hypothetical protein